METVPIESIQLECYRSGRQSSQRPVSMQWNAIKMKSWHQRWWQRLGNDWATIGEMSHVRWCFLRWELRTTVAWAFASDYATLRPEPSCREWVGCRTSRSRRSPFRSRPVWRTPRSTRWAPVWRCRQQRRRRRRRRRRQRQQQRQRRPRQQRSISSGRGMAISALPPSSVVRSTWLIIRWLEAFRIIPTLHPSAVAAVAAAVVVAVVVADCWDLMGDKTQLRRWYRFSK